MMRRGVLLSASAIGAYSTGSILADSKKREQFGAVMSASLRICNLAITVGAIVADYGYHLKVARPRVEENRIDILMKRLEELQTDLEDYTLEEFRSTDGATKKTWQAKIVGARKESDQVSDEIALLLNQGKASGLSAVHKRCAERLCNLCRSNKGVYIKLGQHVSQLGHLVPDEYTTALRPLLADTPRTDYTRVKRVIEEDLGKSTDELFATIEEEPIASASLAQVHVAHGKDGKKYAVKVQHEGLREGSTGDMIAITFLMEQVSRLFEGFSYMWLADEMNANLPVELNFRSEAANCEKCRKNLESQIQSGDVVVPEIQNATNRVLVMSFEEGHFVTDDNALHDMGVQESDVAKIISRTFCDQIFRHGFVHCDPHEANLLVRPHPTKNGKPQVVLLDHGLYRELNDDFRRDYVRLWRALVTSNESEIKYRCERMNAGTIYTLLAAMLTMKPWDDIVSDDMSRLKAKGTRGESEMLKSYAKKYFKQIVGLLGSVPSEMLLLLKTNDCLRNLDRILGVPVNTATITAEVTSEIVLMEDLNSSRGILDATQVVINYVQVMMRVVALRTIEIWLNVSRSWKTWFW